MTRRTLGALWSRYFQVRNRIAAGGMSCVKLRSAEREARGLRDRLVVNYSPLVKYVAGRISGRAGRAPRSGGPHLVGARRAPWRRRDLRSRAPHQVRVVRDLQDPVVHARRAEEGGSPVSPDSPEGPPDREGQGRAGAEAGPRADGVRARRVSWHQRHRAPGVPRPVRQGAGEVARSVDRKDRLAGCTT